MRFWTWSAWQLDWFTWGWVAWIAFFFVWEGIALVNDPLRDPLTAHLRPLFLFAPFTWWVGLGLWLWVGVHFLAPAVERGLLGLLRGS